MINVSNPESIEEMLYACGCSCNHRRLDDHQRAVLSGNVIEMRVGHVLYRCVFDNFEMCNAFALKLKSEGVRVVV